MTPAEHQQIAEVNELWRNMNKLKDIESKREAEKEYLAVTEEQGKGFDWGWDAAVAYLSEPGAMRFFANESITKENDALRKRIADLDALLEGWTMFANERWRLDFVNRHTCEDCNARWVATGVDECFKHRDERTAKNALLERLVEDTRSLEAK